MQHAFPTGWRTAEELASWRRHYEKADVSVGEYDLGGVEWRACLASDLPRAMVTATTVFQGPIEHLPQLREVEFVPFRTGALRMPVKAWEWLLRVSWMTGHASQRACRDQFHQRVTAVAERLCALEQDTLVVSHMGFILRLSEELRRRGFSGPRLRWVKHATAYVFGRSDAAAPNAESAKVAAAIRRSRAHELEGQPPA